MIAHTTFYVKDLAASKAFYDKALAPLGMEITLGSEEQEFWSWGADGAVEFELAQATDESPAHTGIHVAFFVKDQATVDAFHKAALEAGGVDNGAPGPRPQYTDSYYAAFVYDPDGNNIEACYYKTD